MDSHNHKYLNHLKGNEKFIYKNYVLHIDKFSFFDGENPES